MTGTTAELIEGDVYTVEQLLYGLMLPSGNDAAQALARWGGNVILAQIEKKYNETKDIKDTKETKDNKDTQRIQGMLRVSLKDFMK